MCVQVYLNIAVTPEEAHPKVFVNYYLVRSNTEISIVIPQYTMQVFHSIKNSTSFFNLNLKITWKQVARK